MRYDFDIQGQSVSVELEPDPGAPSRFRARLGEESLTVDYRPGHLLVGTRSVAYRVSLSEDGVPRRVYLQGEAIGVRYRQPGRGQARAGPTADGHVVAPMNGQVAKVLRQAGERVGAGQVVLVLEAMKMENEVAAPCDGLLQELKVSQGQTVQPGDPLFVVAPGKE